MRNNYYVCNELARGDILAIWKALCFYPNLRNLVNFVCVGGKIID